MNWGAVIIYSVVLVALMAVLIFGLYASWISFKKEKKMKRYEIILMKILFGFFVFIVIICPFLFGKVIYEQRFRTATGAVAWSRYALPNNGDCDASCKVQCDKGDKKEVHYHYIINSSAESCDCICITICKQCILCENPPDEDVRAWIEGMKR